MGILDLYVSNGGKAIAQSLNFLGDKLPDNASVVVIQKCSGKSFWYQQHVGKRVVVFESVKGKRDLNKTQLKHFSDNYSIYGSKAEFNIRKKDVKVVSRGATALEIENEVNTNMLAAFPRRKTAPLTESKQRENRKIWAEAIHIMNEFDGPAALLMVTLSKKFKIERYV